MAAPSKNNRLLADNVRNLALKQVYRVLNGKDEEFKKQLLLKLAGTILPKLNEHTGEEGKPIEINITSSLEKIYGKSSA